MLSGFRCPSQLSVVGCFVGCWQLAFGLLTLVGCRLSFSGSPCCVFLFCIHSIVLVGVISDLVGFMCCFNVLMLNGADDGPWCACSMNVLATTGAWENCYLVVVAVQGPPHARVQ